MTRRERIDLALAHRGLAAAGLLLLTFALHGGALGSGWKFDDPGLLRYAITHGPLEVFTSRQAMLDLSYAFIAPWNGFFFQIGLPLFGIEPAGHYAHLLLVVAATAFATWLLLRQRCGPMAAWFGAVLWLASAPVAFVSHALMTGHYAYGLLFTVVALLACQRAFAGAGERARWWAAGAYALACLCKELFVPLPLAVLCWPGATWRLRLRVAAPMLAVAVGYVALRGWVLGGLGGYAWLGSAEGPPLRSPWELAGAMAAAAPRALFGAGPDGLFALAVCAAAVVVGGRRLAPAVWRWALVVVALLAAPIAPAMLFDDQQDRARLFYLVAWAGALLVASRLDFRPRDGAIALVVLAAALASQRDAIAAARHPPGALAAQLAFVQRSSERDVLVADGYALLGYLDAMAEVAQRLDGRPRARRVRDEADLSSLGSAVGRAAWAWRADCACLQPLQQEYDRRVAAYAAALEAGRGRTLSVVLELQDLGRRKVFRWSIQGPPGRAYFDVHELGRFEAPGRQGALPFGLDATAPTVPVAHVRATIETADGALLQTPPLPLHLSGTNRVQWQGAAAP